MLQKKKKQRFKNLKIALILSKINALKIRSCKACLLIKVFITNKPIVYIFRRFYLCLIIVSLFHFESPFHWIVIIRTWVGTIEFKAQGARSESFIPPWP